MDRVSLRNTGSSPAYDETFNNYDFSGNLASWYQGVTSEGAWRRTVDARSYYGMDERLRAFQKYDMVPTGSQGRTSGLFEEYRYDPLGRRVAVRTRRPAAMCNQPQQCYTSTTFFVWAGDNLLWEIKNTDGAGAPPESRGVVSYFQAGGIDRPLVIWKNTVGSIVTHQNWRGQFSRGTWGEGTGRVGQSSDCTGTWPQQIECVPVPWPGWNTNAWHDDAAKPQTVGTETYWLGSLSVGMRDASGQMYMRNRYYNPQTGQFTQPDPIGLAGGLNSYGFAAGDPVSYSDPYGLSACDKGLGLWACLKQNVNDFMARARNEPEQLEAGLDAAPTIFTALASGTLGGSVPAARPNPLAGTRYTGKVRGQMRPRNIARQDEKNRTVYDADSDNHGFPLSVDNMAGYGTTKAITGGDGVVRTLVEVDGSYRGRNGTFEWIIEPDSTINHRFFRADP
ncbi:MAG TPA: RHS repeat-associated core domain-containing protein [Longimicrobium sp.]|nr:RHS repeat-associated core domain-containing protein [Longimicrobium sp.]